MLPFMSVVVFCCPKITVLLCFVFPEAVLAFILLRHVSTGVN